MPSFLAAVLYPLFNKIDMMFRRAGAMRCNYFVLHQRNLQRWMEEEGGKLFLWVPGVWCPQLLGGGQGFRALLDMQRDAQGAVWKLLTASAASIFVYMYMKASRDPWLYTWTSGPLPKARAEGVGEALLGLTGKLERNWLWEGSTSVKLVLEVIFSSSCSPDLNTGFASKCWFGSLTSRRDPHP